ncbi:MAG: hypothetical protein JXA37_12645 [Chloroflexia bacterium]|nr:hypothetical protein [Chloroflexia bacterium]
MESPDLEPQGTAFISRFLASGERERDLLREAGADLAGRLYRAARDLAYAKATEFSPKIRLYFQLAAKVALLVYGPDSEAVEPFERNVRYYRNFPSTQALVDEYESFRAAYMESRERS